MACCNGRGRRTARQKAKSSSWVHSIAHVGCDGLLLRHPGRHWMRCSLLLVLHKNRHGEDGPAPPGERRTDAVYWVQSRRFPNDLIYTDCLFAGLAGSFLRPFLQICRGRCNRHRYDHYGPSDDIHWWDKGLLRSCFGCRVLHLLPKLS